jgi:type IV secretion system protein VirB8
MRSTHANRGAAGGMHTDRTSFGEESGSPTLGRANYGASGDSGWGDDIIADLRRSRRTAWTVATGAALLAGVLGVSIAIMLPLKRTEPYVVTVDRETGFVQTARSANVANSGAADAVTRSALTLYVLARETFDPADYRDSYQRVMRWSEGAAEQAFAKDWDPRNPDGIQSRVRPTTRISTTIKSVTLLSAESAIVRYDTVQTDGAGTPQRRPWSATIGFAFKERALPAEDLYLNPMGFQVTSWRRDAETLDSVPVPQAQAGAPAGIGVGPASAAPGAMPMPDAAAAGSVQYVPEMPQAVEIAPAPDQAASSTPQAMEQRP